VFFTAAEAVNTPVNATDAIVNEVGLVPTGSFRSVKATSDIVTMPPRFAERTAIE
jgi:hypothetical protein